ncbi:MAG: hypothetical protein ING84_05580 [Cytophagales bacterium]|nr:hypothetical protein [Cytophagales bacterium]MCA6365884.1 hypothetical protein [Cytophagales bacterium]MCA6371280.1 hypothetical protein [Cytophagales bacterium]MCA6374952.1 hypothetical protein [Cytophagales bacterium]MCA6382739.1 hypothetical protein [Cytophagales bacterium]
MKVYHQTGFRDNWNRECYLNGIGDGLIYSPINIDADKLLALDPALKIGGFLDPQLYLLNEAKGTLHTYPYFPGNIKPDFSTPDLDNSHIQMAKLCVDYQLKNDFSYLVIPTRYYTDNPTTYFVQSTDYFVTPFCDYVRTNGIKKKILLSVIVKSIMLGDEEKRNEVLNWITGHQQISGVYLIFEDNFNSKQIKDFEYLLNALRFIRILKSNQMEVHLGYTSTEGILYSIAMPDSVTIGSYENLRSFGIKRFQDLENGPMRAPRARLYSSKLLQWLDYQYVEAMRSLIPNYEDFFDESEFRPLMFKPEYNWQFQKPEPYKHYFYVFDRQVKALPNGQPDRIESLKGSIRNAVNLFRIIENEVLLDDDSNGSHLPTWFNVINAFQKEIV